MAANSSIEWTEATWNPVTGCSKISPGCKHCYAERMARRLREMGQPRYVHGFEVTLQEDVVELPLRWRRPRTIFVNSMSDLFHEDVPLDFLRRVFVTMERASWHTFQVLTKRSARLREVSSQLLWPRNVWMGVSVENDRYISRVHDLVQVPSAVRFLSVEPLLGPIRALPLMGVDWVIVGGESGPGARAMEEDWVTDIRDQCRRADVRFFFKQWGGVQKGRAGRRLEGQLWDELPTPRDRAAEMKQMVLGFSE